jgi:hypothetical protein
MTPDYQEALSRKYSGDLFMILPLSSGRFAVFSPRRDVIDVVAKVEDALPAFKRYLDALTRPLKPHWHEETTTIAGITAELDL